MPRLADGLHDAFDPRTTGPGRNGGTLWARRAWTAPGALALPLFRWDNVKT